MVPVATAPEIRPVGDSAVLVIVADRVGLEAASAVRRLDLVLRRIAPDGIVDVVPALASLLIRFDPATWDPAGLAGLVADAAAAAEEADLPPPRRWRIPAIYGGAHGPDLDAVAEALGLDRAAVVAAHAAEGLTVLANGFAPGFCYLGMLPVDWDLPRRRTLHRTVPPGSISVAVRQTVLSATPMPTGWSTIAWTPLVNLREGDPGPLVIRAGDIVRFEPAPPSDRDRLTALAAAGRLPEEDS